MQTSKCLVCVLVLSIIGCWALPALAGAEEGVKFPLRAKYSELSPISTEDLIKVFSEAVIVDARNSAEYEVIHMTGAHNILVGKMKKADLLKLRDLDSDRPLVFYCNGTTCSKSYKAGKKADIWGFKNVYVYDAGIFNWAETQPENTEFFGKPMTHDSAQVDLITAMDFGTVCLEPAAFLAKAQEPGYQVFDLRDREERTEIPIKLPGIKKVTLDEFRSFLSKDKLIPQSKILVIDNVGKQVKWLQYYFNRFDRTDYYFLKGGVLAWNDAGYDGKGNQTGLANAPTGQE